MRAMLLRNALLRELLVKIHIYKPPLPLNVNIKSHYAQDTTDILQGQGGTRSSESIQDILDSFSERRSKAAPIKMQTPAPNSTDLPKQYSDILKSVKELPKFCINVLKSNIIVILTSNLGAPIARSSGGEAGFKNCKKGTDLAAWTAANRLGKRTLLKNIKKVHVKIKGLNMKCRKSAMQGLLDSGVQVVAISDTTILPFGPQRPRGPRSL